MSDTLTAGESQSAAVIRHTVREKGGKRRRKAGRDAAANQAARREVVVVVEVTRTGVFLGRGDETVVKRPNMTMVAVIEVFQGLMETTAKSRR